MSNTEIVLSLNPDQQKQVVRISAYHSGFVAGFKQQMGYAYLAGRELVSLKESLPHGDFQEACSAYLPGVTERTAQRYMKLHARLELNVAGGKNDTVSHLKLLPNGELSEEAEKAVLAAVYEAADGKTMTDLYRDTDLIREKKAPKHTPPKELTPEETIAARREQANAILNICAGQMEFIAEAESMHDPDADAETRKRFKNAYKAIGARYKKKKSEKKGAK